ncbi:histidine phosphatase family protein, partial [Streptomyces pseudovenezuelae]|uniref:histidine phosphatase family protein n=1 Tax=Streptomyces pseudovenezuelae TaxID=67350 RepID=UPI0034A48FC6
MSVADPRRIVLFRHAKADWPQVTDHERPLADRGRTDAAEAGLRLVDSGIPLDLALCSTATRTRERERRPSQRQGASEQWIIVSSSWKFNGLLMSR